MRPGARALAAVALVLATGAVAGKRHRRPKAVVPATSPAPPSAPFECPASQRVALDADAWKLQLLSLHGWREHNRALAKLRVRPVWIDRQSAAFPTCEEIATLQDVDVHAVDLTDSETVDLVIEARYALCVKGDPIALRVQVLRPLGKGVYCALSDELSADRDASGLPCELGGRPPRTLDFVSLLSKERQAIAVRDVTGRCDEHPARREELGYFSVDGGALRRLFQLTTLERARLDSGEERVVTREVTASGDYPKALEVTETSHVGAADEPSRKTTYLFRGEGYQAR